MSLVNHEGLTILHDSTQARGKRVENVGTGSIPYENVTSCDRRKGGQLMCGVGCASARVLPIDEASIAQTRRHFPGNAVRVERQLPLHPDQTTSSIMQRRLRAACAGAVLPAGAVPWLRLRVQGVTHPVTVGIQATAVATLACGADLAAGASLLAQVQPGVVADAIAVGVDKIDDEKLDEDVIDRDLFHEMKRLFCNRFDAEKE